MKLNIKKILIIFIVLFLFTNKQFAKEILIFADNISYDADKNLIAKGKAKVISGNEIITSELIIIDEINKRVILPKEFNYKDEDSNYYYGTSGEFSSNFNIGKINDIKMILKDGSRIVGKTAYKDNDIDLIDKGVYSPCKSKINIKNFVCPIWQLESEKMLHDKDKLFLYNKHVKMRVLNVPIYYFPYMVNPSPLRKERKSGFLSPKISLMFLDAQTIQNVSFPYYFVMGIDKDLILTPTINYGGGVDASQSLNTAYRQLTSGGSLDINASADTNFEEQNNENWLRDASIAVGLSHIINKKFNMTFNSTIQTSPTYLRRTDQNNILNRQNTLSTTFNLYGSYLRNIDDKLHVNVSGYQVVKNKEDNKTTPTTLPYINYSLGRTQFKKTQIDNNFSFYNIFRDIATADHAKKQQKLHHGVKTNNEFFYLFSKLNFRTELHTQFYNIEKKKISNNDYTGTYVRSFPMTGLYFETPLINKKANLRINPTASFVINGSQTSTNKVSNEESTNNGYSLLNSSDLNRFTGTDKLDNSKRVNYGVDVTKDLFGFELGQSYEIDGNSTYNKEVGLKDYMSDLLGTSYYNGKKNGISHSFRANVDQGKIASQSLNYGNSSKIGNITVGYTEEKQEVNSILKKGSKTLGINFGSNAFLDYSTISTDVTFDMIEENPKSYNLHYVYADECFGINIDWSRGFFSDRDLKPTDTLTILFSFKDLGGYQSTNLAVSEKDKENIRWNTTK